MKAGIKLNLAVSGPKSPAQVGQCLRAAKLFNRAMRRAFRHAPNGYPKTHARRFWKHYRQAERIRQRCGDRFFVFNINDVPPAEVVDSVEPDY